MPPRSPPPRQRSLASLERSASPLSFHAGRPTRDSALCGLGVPCGLARRLVRALPRGGAKYLVPIWSADTEALRVVLEVMAHVTLAQHPAHARMGAKVVDVVVEHVVDQIPRKEARPNSRG